MIGDTRKERLLIGPSEHFLHEIDVARTRSEVVPDRFVRAGNAEAQPEHSTCMARRCADSEVPGVIERITEEVVPDLRLVRELPFEPRSPSVREIAHEGHIAVESSKEVGNDADDGSQMEVLVRIPDRACMSVATGPCPPRRLP